MNSSELFIDLFKVEFRKSKALAEKAMAQLDDQQLFQIPAEGSNSIAIIVRHVAGNMISRWTDFYTSDGEKPDRNRDSEFEQPEFSRNELMARWENGWKVFLDVIDNLKEDDLLKTVYIRKEPHSVMQAVFRQHAHYNNHIGQIVQLAKMLKGGSFVSLSIPKGESEKFNSNFK
jgi:hypothetical protein